MKRGYRRLQKVTGDNKLYRGSSGVEGAYKELNRVTRGCMSLQGIQRVTRGTGAYKRLNRVIRGYKGLQMLTRGYMGL